MTQPLAIVFYERLMPGSQLVNRLQDLNYRVLAVNRSADLAATARRESPLIVIADLEAAGDVCGAIAQIKADDATKHLPVIAFAPDHRPDLTGAAQNAGASLAVGESALMGHLATALEQALHID